MPDQTKLSTIITALPDRLKADYAKNADGFSGTTVDMNGAASNMVANLRHMWIDVATAGFPAQAFGGPPDQWLQKYIDVERQLSGVLNEPEGPGTGGTIVGQLVGGDLMNTLQHLIARTVEALTSTQDNKTMYDAWLEKWKAAQG